MINIILVDDHALFRDGIKSLISSDEIKIIGEFDNGENLLADIDNLAPDMVITDISMPGISGIELTRILSKDYPDIPVIILSMHNNEDFISNAIKVGAKAYLPKDIRRDDLLEAIQVVSDGSIYFSKEINKTIMNSFVSKAKMSSDGKEQKPLTNRENEVIKLICDGLINKEIADQLNISIRTVDAHKCNIMHKLGLKSNVELVKYAIKNELISI